MTHRIYITRPIQQNGVDMLIEKGYDVTMGTDSRPLPPGKLNKILSKAHKAGQGYSGVITLLTDKIGADILESAPDLKIVSNFAIGYDNIDVASLTSKGVRVTNTPGDYCDVVAQHVLALALALTNHIVAADTFIRKGKYVGWDPMLFVGRNIHDCTIGLIGAGHIGEKAAFHFKTGFNCKIVYSDVHPNLHMESEYGAVRLNTADEVLAQADIISLHVPLLPSTQHMINESSLKKMKSTAILINTSRGAVIDEQALVKALKEKRIAGAGLDVFEFEPKLAKGLNKLENVILTPHIASASDHARFEMSRIAAQNIIDVLEGRVPVGNIQL